MMPRQVKVKKADLRVAGVDIDKDIGEKEEKLDQKTGDSPDDVMETMMRETTGIEVR